MKRPDRRKAPSIHTDRPPTGRKTGHIVPRSKTDHVVRAGLETSTWTDLYHQLLTMGWWRFMLTSSGAYLLINAVFAALYVAQPGSITNAAHGSFLDAFFFSVQTFATIGYGAMVPATLYANVVFTLESFVGLIIVAITTGLMFARISRPTARVKFAKVAVITQYEGKRALMLRMGNERRSQIVEAVVRLAVLRSQYTKEGRFMRRFQDLRLERSQTPVFALSFTAIHIIDETSPLFGLTEADLRREEIELLASVTGLEEGLSQTVHARVSFTEEEILMHRRYVDIFGVTDDGRRGIDFSRFDDTEPDPHAEQAAA